MADDRGRYYTSAPKIRDAMQRHLAEHEQQLALWIRDLESIGGERNEVLALLSSLAAVAADRALQVLGRRFVTLCEAEGLGSAADVQDEAARACERLFLEDVMVRVRLHSAERARHG